MLTSDSDSTEVSLVAVEPLIRAHRLNAKFGERLVLDHVDFEVMGGEIVAIAGRSGSGKTTLLRALSGILPVDSGEITYGPVRIDALGDTDRTLLRRTDFGFVFQNSLLIPELTALENVVLPLLLRGDRRDEANERGQEWLTRVSVDHRSGAYPAQLSGGESQRVALARAMVIDPKVIFADEPTGSLDSHNAEIVMGQLVSAATSAGASVIVVTHDQSTAAYASRQIEFSDGRILG